MSRPTRQSRQILKDNYLSSGNCSLANIRFPQAWYTRLSLSMARLSKRFYSLRKFLTLCRLMVASAPIRNSDNYQLSVSVVCMSQPLIHFRLPTYPSEIVRWKWIRFGLFHVRSPLLAESLFTFSSSGY